METDGLMYTDQTCLTEVAIWYFLVPNYTPQPNPVKEFQNLDLQRVFPQQVHSSE